MIIVEVGVLGCLASLNNVANAASYLSFQIQSLFKGLDTAVPFLADRQLWKKQRKTIFIQSLKRKNYIPVRRFFPSKFSEQMQKSNISQVLLESCLSTINCKIKFVKKFCGKRSRNSRDFFLVHVRFSICWGFCYSNRHGGKLSNRNPKESSPKFFAKLENQFWWKISKSWEKKLWKFMKKQKVKFIQKPERHFEEESRTKQMRTL